MKLIDNTQAKQFELNIDGHLASSEYILNNKDIYLTSTDVDPALKGSGAGGKLMQAVFAEIENRGLKLVPLCPFVASDLKRHPEWNHIT